MLRGVTDTGRRHIALARLIVIVGFAIEAGSVGAAFVLAGSLQVGLHILVLAVDQACGAAPGLKLPGRGRERQDRNSCVAMFGR